jgi:uncharacterized protein YecT (DUF1311 family)
MEYEELIKHLLQDILETTAVSYLSATMTPSRDDFSSDAEFQIELDYLKAETYAVDAEINWALNHRLQDLSEDQKELFRLMVWQHVDYKKGWLPQSPSLHPECFMN